MKKLILTTAAIVTLAPAAFAMSSSQTLSEVDKAEIRRIMPSADLDNLTVAVAGALAAALHSSGSHGEKGAEIRAILN